MSVVVAIKNKDHVLVGCDGQLTYGYTKSNLTIQKKIWKPTDDKNIVMGLVGTLRDANILSVAEGWVDELTELKNSVDLKYVIKNIIPKVFMEIECQGRLNIKDGIKSMASNITFAYKDKAYGIYSDGAVIEMDDIIADGSGFRLCLGAWNNLKDKDISAREKLVQTIKAACESDIYVNYPIIIMNTKDDRIDIVEK